MGLQARLAGEHQTARVFLADALDNGAGYAVELGEPEVFRRILRHARLELAAAWEDAAHARYCTVSCPDCLRSCGQQAAARGTGLEARPRHAGPRRREAPGPAARWLTRGASAARAFAQSAGGWLAAEPSDGLTALVNKADRKAVVLGHPLWRREEEHLTTWQRKVLGAVTASTGIQDVALSDLYELDRQPLAVLRLLS